MPIEVLLPAVHFLFLFIVRSGLVFRQRLRFAYVRFCLPFQGIYVARRSNLLQVPITWYLLVTTSYRTMVLISAQDVDLSGRPFFMALQGFFPFEVYRRNFYGDEAMGTWLLKGVLPTIVGSVFLLKNAKRRGASKGAIPFFTNRGSILFCLMVMVGYRSFIKGFRFRFYHPMSAIYNVRESEFQERPNGSSLFSPINTMFCVG